jgi:type I restriction-modification system DNA methylase subunit
MPLSWNEIRLRAANFVDEWQDRAINAREEADAQDFQTDFLNVFGVSRRQVANFEHRVSIGGQEDLFGDMTGGRRGYIDLFWKGRIIIEMKTPGKDMIKAYQQAKEYAVNLPPADLPEGILISDFNNFDYYNLEKDNEVEHFTLLELPQKVELFGYLAGYKDITFQAVSPVDIEAAEHMGELHDALKENNYTGHELEIYLVRLLFCLFADDSGIFDEKKLFFRYINERTNEDGSDLALHLGYIFETLNKPREKRLKNIDETLNKFPYIDGNLFEERLETAAFNSIMRKTLLKCCTLDWLQIKPEIFGAMFQSVKDKEKRRALGEHYTSETNILKVIKPLFLDELWEEFEKIRKLKSEIRIQRLLEFHTRLRKLKFLDPACGCGNFLVVSYRELRLLEIEVLSEYLQTQQVIDIELMIRVNVDQFYGIEIVEFPARIAQTALWLMDHLMNKKASERFGKYIARIPLTASPNIVISNALPIDWETIVPKSELSYILGNPPFVGKKEQSLEQKKELLQIFEKKASKLDYVTCWYKKAAQYIQGTDIEAAFVSTNSICQGEQVTLLWPELINKHGIKINFAHQTFKWNNEARGKAAVHCIIAGFGLNEKAQKKLFIYSDVSSDPVEIKANKINAYLLSADNVFIETRQKPICNVPNIYYGNIPIDDGHLILEEEEYKSLIKKEPFTKAMLRPYYGGYEFLNNKKRYCLWLEDISPAEIAKSHFVKDRIEKTRKFRLSSGREATRDLAAMPSLFGYRIKLPTSDYLLIPKVSSENRPYIPIGFMKPKNITNGSALIIPNAGLYEFGILTSVMHMAWMRYICGRMKSDYQYSASLVYNNFPWPELNEKKKELIKKSAQAVLDTRLLFPDSTLAELYNPSTMPPKLVKAHQKLDKAVEAAYDRSFDDDSQRVAYLFELYQKLCGELFVEEKKRGKGRKIFN